MDVGIEWKMKQEQQQHTHIESSDNTIESLYAYAKEISEV